MKNGTHCTTILVNRLDICGTQNGTQIPFLNNENKKPLKKRGSKGGPTCTITTPFVY